jgi:hypothetical protein
VIISSQRAYSAVTAAHTCRRNRLSRALGADLQITFVEDRDPLTRGWRRIADHLRAAGSGETYPLLDRVRVADAVRARSAALWSSRLTPWFTSRGMMDLSCSKYSGSRRRRREGKKRNSIRSSKDRRLEGRETRIVKNPLSLTVRSTQTVK